MNVSGTLFVMENQRINHTYPEFVNLKTMKTVVQILIFCFAIILPVSSQENFKVIKVNGTIVLKAKGTSLETGTVFSSKEDLLFRSDDATAAVINSQQGRLILTSKNHDLTDARTNQMPSMYNIGTRSVTLPGGSEIEDYFSGKHVVLEKEAVIVDGLTYPMNEDHFFFLRYVYNNEEINKKLSFSGDTLFVDKSTLFTVDGKPIPSADKTSIKLYYHRGSQSVAISEFDLIFPDMTQLTKEVEIILSEIQGKSSNEKVAEIDSYIKDFYGKISRDNLTEWLETKFGIK